MQSCIFSGVLSRPGVTLVNDSQSVNITLDKPYCLPGAVISHYGSEVHVPNQNKTILTNFTNPEISFVFSEHTDISRCDSQYINISLCAYNLAGEGEFSYVEVFVPSDMKYCDPKDVDRSLICKFSLYLQPNFDLCPLADFLATFSVAAATSMILGMGNCTSVNMI